MANWYDGVPVPRDKDGNVVPLATMRLYDEKGREVEVGEIALVDSILYGRLVWRVRTHGGVSLGLDLLHLAPPDSWERLESDINELARMDSACRYFESGNETTCDACPAKDCAESCFIAAIRDILRRIKALREAERDGD